MCCYTCIHMWDLIIRLQHASEQRPKVKSSGGPRVEPHSHTHHDTWHFCSFTCDRIRISKTQLLRRGLLRACGLNPKPWNLTSRLARRPRHCIARFPGGEIMVVGTSYIYIYIYMLSRLSRLSGVRFVSRLSSVRSWAAWADRVREIKFSTQIDFFYRTNKLLAFLLYMTKYKK